MAVETKIQTTFKNYLAGKSAITAITGLTGVRNDEDYSIAVTYPCLLVKAEPAYDIAGFEAPMYTTYKETRVVLTCETYKADDLSGASVVGLYDAVLTNLNISTILSALDTASVGTLAFYESKIMPEEGLFDDTEEIRQRILTVRVKVREITS